MSLHQHRLSETPIAVIDLETTGLSANSDRIVEIAIVRVDPGEAPRVVLDTLVDPQRRVSCSEIHGIYDDDVEGAPMFHELQQPIAEALDGAVVASFNVYFDIKFVEAELQRSSIPLPFPHLCMMWLRPTLGLGNRATLGATCSALGITFEGAHRASTDALATSALWPLYVDAARTKNIHTFGDIAALRTHKYIRSWTQSTIDARSLSLKPLQTALKPRFDRSEDERRDVRRREERPVSVEIVESTPLGFNNYWQAILSAIVDGDITDDEILSLRSLQKACNLTPDALRYVHGRVLAGLLDDMSSDLRIDAGEQAWLEQVMYLLDRLGWAPGGRVMPASAAPAAESSTQRSAVRPSWWGKVFG